MVSNLAPILAAMLVPRGADHSAVRSAEKWAGNSVVGSAETLAERSAADLVGYLVDDLVGQTVVGSAGG